MDKRRKKGNQNSFKKISKIIPALIIFLLPGGSFLLPILAGVLDRKKPGGYLRLTILIRIYRVDS
jgi:hypothetical protein